MDDKQNVLMTFIVGLLAVGGGVIGSETLDDAFNNELSDYYVCIINDNIAIDPDEFARLSGTDYTAYPFKDSRVGQVRCIDEAGNKGVWNNLKDYAFSIGLDPYTLINENKSINNVDKNYSDIGWGKSYKVYPKK